MDKTIPELVPLPRVCAVCTLDAMRAIVDRVAADQTGYTRFLVGELQMCIADLESCIQQARTAPARH